MKAKIGEWIEVNHEQGFLEVVSGEVEIYVLYRADSGNTRRVFLREAEAGSFVCAIPKSISRELSLLVIPVKEANLALGAREAIAAFPVDKRAKIMGECLRTFSVRPGSHWRNSPEETSSAEEMRSAEMDERENYFAMLEQACGAFCQAYRQYFQAELEKAKADLTDTVQSRQLLWENAYHVLFEQLSSNLPFVKRSEDRIQPAVVHALMEIGRYYGISSRYFRLPESALCLTEARDIVRLLGHRHLFSREIELPADWYALPPSRLY